MEYGIYISCRREGTLSVLQLPLKLVAPYAEYIRHERFCCEKRGVCSAF